MQTQALTLPVLRPAPITKERPRAIPRVQPQAHPARESLTPLVRAAAAGDVGAWPSIVERLTPALKAAARSFRLSPADVDDVVQDTWLAAFRHIGRLDHPEALASWLLVTTRRASLRKHQYALREVVTDEPPTLVAPERESPLRVVIEAERADALQAALDRLPDRQRELLGTLLSEPDASYDDISPRVGMPVGSIGPTRRRALERLRRDRRLANLVADQPTV